MGATSFATVSDGNREARSWPDVLAALMRGEDLPAASTAWAMDQVMSGEATPVQVAGFIVALRAKGETVDEVRGLVEAMYAHATTIEVPGPVVDIVGTGGDRARTVNISTMSAMVVAGAGATVVKPGTLAASPTSSRPSASSSTSPPSRSRAPRPRPASRCASRRSSTPRCGTPRRPAANSACRPPSTSSAR
jgi:anthranilate phosphoribosyltransferase